MALPAKLKPHPCSFSGCLSLLSATQMDRHDIPRASATNNMELLWQQRTGWKMVAKDGGVDVLGYVSHLIRESSLPSNALRCSPRVDIGHCILQCRVCADASDSQEEWSWASAVVTGTRQHLHGCVQGSFRQPHRPINQSLRLTICLQITSDATSRSMKPVVKLWCRKAGIQTKQTQVSRWSAASQILS